MNTFASVTSLRSSYLVRILQCWQSEELYNWIGVCAIVLNTEKSRFMFYVQVVIKTAN